ncbi:hypothetical protein FJZ18_03600 [Candidatus Pacearchaeota archaeon]|nr:hypothetical protein [Candidatus Pacearchaeota archaeon]
MSWKKWSYETKGAFIGLLIGLILLVLSLFMPVYCIGLSEDGTSPCKSFSTGETVSFHLSKIMTDDSLIYLILLISGVLIGVIVGWIIKKIKTKK